MFGAGGGFSAFTQPTGYGFDYHAGTGHPSPDACHIAGRAMGYLSLTTEIANAILSVIKDVFTISFKFLISVFGL
jgi:hypothetical protein